MTRYILACCLSLLCLCHGTFGQVAKGQQPPAAPSAIDSEYRKLDDLASLVRTRNAQQYAIASPKGIDEASFVTVGGIEQWITIRGEDRDNPVLLFLQRWAWRCDQSLDICVIRSMGEVLLGGAMGSEGSWQDVEKKWPSSCADDHRGSYGARRH